jgi:MFS family permease
VLAVPAAVWVSAGVEQLFGECDFECGDRDRGYFLLVLVTAPLIPAGLALVARWPPGATLAALGRVVCLLAAGLFVLLALAIAGVAVGAWVDVVERNYPVNLDDPAGSRQGAIVEVVMWALAALWCLLVAAGLVAVRRRLRRRYPSGAWPPSDRSTSEG